MSNEIDPNDHRGMLIHGLAATSAVDSSGEILDVDGCDISTLDQDGTLNWEHKNGTATDTVGKIVYAKKLFAEKDCETEEQRKFWKQVELPCIYIIARLYDQAGHTAAKDMAAQIRDHVANGEPPIVRFSVEGTTLKTSADKRKLLVSIARRVAATLTPCNRSAVSGILLDPNAPKGFATNPQKVKEEVFKPFLKSENKEHPLYAPLGGATAYVYDPVLAKGWPRDEAENNANRAAHEIVQDHFMEQGAKEHKGKTANTNRWPLKEEGERGYAAQNRRIEGAKDAVRNGGLYSGGSPDDMHTISGLPPRKEAARAAWGEHLSPEDAAAGDSRYWGHVDTAAHQAAFPVPDLSLPNGGTVTFAWRHGGGQPTAVDSMYWEPGFTPRKYGQFGRGHHIWGYHPLNDNGTFGGHPDEHWYGGRDNDDQNSTAVIQHLNDFMAKNPFAKSEFLKAWPKSGAENRENAQGFLNNPVALDQHLANSGQQIESVVPQDEKFPMPREYQDFANEDEVAEGNTESNRRVGVSDVSAGLPGFQDVARTQMPTIPSLPHPHSTPDDPQEYRFLPGLGANNYEVFHGFPQRGEAPGYQQYVGYVKPNAAPTIAGQQLEPHKLHYQSGLDHLPQILEHVNRHYEAELNKPMPAENDLGTLAQKSELSKAADDPQYQRRWVTEHRAKHGIYHVSGDFNGSKQGSVEVHYTGHKSKKRQHLGAFPHKAAAQQALLEHHDRVVAAGLHKALDAGSYNAAPGTLTGGAALQVEDQSLRRRKLKEWSAGARKALEKFDWTDGDLKAHLKHELPEASQEFIDRFSDLVDDYRVNTKGSLLKAMPPATPEANQRAWEEQQVAHDQLRETFGNEQVTSPRSDYGGPEFPDLESKATDKNGKPVRHSAARQRRIGGAEHFNRVTSSGRGGPSEEGFDDMDSQILNEQARPPPFDPSGGVDTDRINDTVFRWHSPAGVAAFLGGHSGDPEVALSAAPLADGGKPRYISAWSPSHGGAYSIHSVSPSGEVKTVYTNYPRTAGEGVVVRGGFEASVPDETTHADIRQHLQNHVNTLSQGGKSYLKSERDYSRTARTLERLGIELRKAVAEMQNPKAAEAPKDQTVQWQGKKVIPGALTYQGENFKLLGSDPHHFYAVSPEMDQWGPEDIQKLPRRDDDGIYEVNYPKEVGGSGVVDMNIHGTAHNDTKQKALVNGMDMQQQPIAASRGMNKDNSGWYKTPSGLRVYVKGDGLNGAFHRNHKEIAYHNLARDFFGLGEHVPTTANFFHPETGQEMVAVAPVEGGYHPEKDRDGTLKDVSAWRAMNEHQQRDGTVDKLALMDTIAGNNDRSQYNWMLDNKGKPWVIDHGHAFVPSPAQAQRDLLDSWGRTQDLVHGRPADSYKAEPLHDTARQWLQNLEANKLAEHAQRLGIPENYVADMQRRLQLLQQVNAQPEARRDDYNMKVL